jgi:arylsulfatase A-like enzyme
MINKNTNILLIVLDSVRIGNTSLFSTDQDTTPRLRELTEQATQYKNAVAPGVGSPQSHTSMFRYFTNGVMGRINPVS